MAKPLNQLAEELFKRGLAAEGLLAKFDSGGRDLAALRKLVFAAQALAWEEGRDSFEEPNPKNPYREGGGE